MAYTENIFVGYRHYDTSDIEVLFPFGHGLSYTEFDLSELAVVLKMPGERPQVRVSLKVSNTGKTDGKEVVQIYVGKPESEIDRPKKVLAAFTKVELSAGESRRIELTLNPDAFTYYNEKTRKFTVEPGTYQIYAGKSVADICQIAFCEL